jgi:hypothetical protein
MRESRPVVIHVTAAFPCMAQERAIAGRQRRLRRVLGVSRTAFQDWQALSGGPDCG